ncbi:MAG: hypothetical protein NWQ06_06105 [Leeuwenhoekiella sp.]|nr:hypothetical protein [Leeuwenhoekiella sp.]
MKKFKENWEITQNWQLIYPFLGIVLALGSGLLIAYRFNDYFESGSVTQLLFLGIATHLIAYLFIKKSLCCFEKLKNRSILE